MRWMIAMVALGLAGCAQPQSGAAFVPTQPPMTAQQLEALRSSEAARRNALERGFERDRLTADETFARDQQAATICRERGNAAAAQPAYGGQNLSGAVYAGLQQGWAGSETEAACLRAYRGTNIMPSY